MRFFFKTTKVAKRDIDTMLEKIRDGSQGMIAKVILGFVILTFALAGVGSYLGNTSEVPVANSVAPSINFKFPIPR